MPEKNRPGKPRKERAPKNADSSWWASHLTDKQRMYGVFLVECEGNQREAARRAGYSDRTSIESIEDGPAMQEYMAAVRREIATVSGITASLVLSRVNRIAVKAFEEKDYANSLRAETMLANHLGLLETKSPQINVNGDGNVIQIVAAPASRPMAQSDFSEEERRELEMNGMGYLLDSLPEHHEVLEAEVIGE